MLYGWKQNTTLQRSLLDVMSTKCWLIYVRHMVQQFVNAIMIANPLKCVLAAVPGSPQAMPISSRRFGASIGNPTDQFSCSCRFALKKGIQLSTTY